MIPHLALFFSSRFQSLANVFCGFLILYFAHLQKIKIKTNFIFTIFCYLFGRLDAGLHLCRNILLFWNIFTKIPHYHSTLFVGFSRPPCYSKTNKKHFIKITFKKYSS